jgi:hypothetical protein
MKRVKETSLKAVKVVKDKDYNALILLTKESTFKLSPRSGELECFDVISKKIISIKFKKTSNLYNLLLGYMMIKDNFKKSRYIAIEVNLKNNATVLEDKKLKAVEKKYKIDELHWSLVHKGTFGIV